MAFWGVELKLNKPYVHRPDDERGRLHVSQATLGAGSSTDKSIVLCKVGNKKPIYLCSLLPEKLETCALNLEFEEEDEVTFSVVGSLSVHLSGFFYGDNEDQDYEEDDYDSDSYKEDVMVTDSDGDDYLECGSGDDYQDNDFSDDGINMFPSAAAPNSGVRIEEIIDDENLSEDGIPKKANKRAKKQLTGTDGKNNQQIVVRAGTAASLSESEDEDGFPLSCGKKPSSSKAALTPTIGDKLEKKDEGNDATCQKNLKRKINGTNQDRELARETTEVCEPSAQPENKAKKRKSKKKKLAEKEEVPLDEKLTSCGTEESPVVTSGSELKTSSEKKKETRNKKKNNQQEASEENLKDGKESSVEKHDSKDTKPMQVRSFPNGLVVEELVMGKPDGKRASPGKKVSVFYIGKLKKSGKIFDSNIGRAPFKFRLGIGQVIKGWDVGVNGMRVGDKRRLAVPPVMGYGAKGCGAAIPPNSWLVFDVELVDVN